MAALNIAALNLQVRIWLSIGIFVLGFLLSTVFAQVQSLRSEELLRSTADSLFPAARTGHDAVAAFDRLISTYSDVFIIEDELALDRASGERAQVVKFLEEIAGNPGVPATTSSEAHRLAREILQFSAKASRVYGSVLPSRATAGTVSSDEVRALGVQTEALKGSIVALDRHLTSAVEQGMNDLSARSSWMRTVVLGVFGITIAIATVLVNLTIRRSIVTPLKELEAELEYERDLLRFLMDHVPDYIYFKDSRSRFVRVNKAQSELMGIPDPAGACGRSDADFFDAETARQTRADEQRVLATGEPLVAKVERVAGRHETRWVMTTKARVGGDHESKQMIVGISRDITDLKRMMEVLAESEGSFRLLFAAIPHAVWVYDAGTLRFLEVNATACRHYGYTPGWFESHTVADLYPSEDADRFAAESASAEPLQGTWRHVTANGRVLEVEITARTFTFKNLRAVLMVAQDITERRRLELELQHAQRLEAVGQLAAGIAHEINTPIQYVGDNLRFLHDAFRDRQAVFERYDHLREVALARQSTDLIVDELEQARDEVDWTYICEEIPKAIDQSLDGVERVTTIVRAMKAFAHPGQREKAAADLNKALQDSLIVARNELKYTAEVVTDFGDLPLVVCHIADLNQVFLNLLINASHAISEASKTDGGGMGRIVVKTRFDGVQVTIAISDTGCGVPTAIRSRIFDPFFTTKDVGKGTGQGLSIARTIVVEKHGGRITFEPNLPRGTTFIVQLPAEPSCLAGVEVVDSGPEVVPV